jgi:hypothetical protein
LNALCASCYRCPTGGWWQDARQRSEEERNGTVRYLRPAYQNPSKLNQDTMLEVPDEPTLAPAKLEKIAFPKTRGEQPQAIRNVLKTIGKPLSSMEIGRFF